LLPGTLASLQWPMSSSEGVNKALVGRPPIDDSSDSLVSSRDFDSSAASPLSGCSEADEA
jgi:hypothetical protein